MTEYLIVISRNSILGRKNCSKCGAWLHLLEFGSEIREKSDGKLHVYIKSECRKCNNRRVKEWRKTITPSQRRRYRSKERKAHRYQRERQKTLQMLGKAFILPNGRADSWPVRRWLIISLQNGTPLDELAFVLDRNQSAVEDLIRGWREGRYGPTPLRTVPVEMIWSIKQYERTKRQNEYEESRRGRLRPRRESSPAGSG